MRQWISQHQGTILLVATVIGAAAAVLALFLSGGSDDGPRTTPDPPIATTAPEPTSETSTETTQTTPEPPPGPVGLTELNESEDVEFSVDADFSTRNINGETHNDAVTGLVYSDDSGFTSLAIETKRRFDAVSFTVGIDAEAECPRARARVSLTDQSGRVLWGPEVVTIDNPRSEQDLAIPRPIQVNLEQKSLVTGENACGNTEAQVSWGSVVFKPAPE